MIRPCTTERGSDPFEEAAAGPADKDFTAYIGSNEKTDSKETGDGSLSPFHVYHSIRSQGIIIIRAED